MFKFILGFIFISSQLFSLEQSDVLKSIQEKKMYVEMDLDSETFDDRGTYYLMGYWDALNAMEYILSEEL